MAAGVLPFNLLDPAFGITAVLFSCLLQVCNVQEPVADLQMWMTETFDSLDQWKPLTFPKIKQRTCRPYRGALPTVMPCRRKP